MRKKKLCPAGASYTHPQGAGTCGGETLILAAIQGLLKSKARGVATDGHPRQVADYITVYLVVDGEIDLDRGFDPAVNSLKA